VALKQPVRQAQFPVYIQASGVKLVPGREKVAVPVTDYLRLYIIKYTAFMLISSVNTTRNVIIVLLLTGTYTFRCLTFII